MSGLFWPEERKPVKGKKTIPEPTWLADDYLPGLKEALEFDVDLMTDEDLVRARNKKEQLVCDIEIYENYFLAAFTSMESAKCVYIEFDDQGFGQCMDIDKLRWILNNFQIVTFNGIHFDLPILALALAGKTTGEMKHATNMIIQQDIKPWLMLKSFKVEPLEIDHIDLIEVCPLQASLKIYGGRLHAPKMQDLPFPPDAILSPEQIAIVRHYCINDLTTTAIVNVALEEQLSVRKGMSAKYNVDLRSKSDAQIAEAVIKKELMRMNGIEPKRPDIEPGTAFRYKVPEFITFKTEILNTALGIVKKSRFVVAESGAVTMPPALAELKIEIGKSIYQMGIGGLHSTESCVVHKADKQFRLVDRDVASYYPAIILNQGLYPSHLGQRFLNVYHSLVERRLAAKKSGNKIEADMLKIVINGSFGKFGSKWSALYSPDLLIQVTLTGQLCLLMLIERLESSGIQVCSANTDGIVMRFPRVMQDTVDKIIKGWEKLTNFETEETEYAALYSRDINNYIAIKPDGKTKTKGAYSIGQGIFRFHKNPTNTICVEAALEYLTKGTRVRDTIRACKDLTKFLTVRSVKGGAVKDGVFLGKAIRWYMSTGAAGEIVYALSGNKVPKSEGAEPCMELPDEFPNDIDYGRYESEAWQILKDIGATKDEL